MTSVSVFFKKLTGTFLDNAVSFATTEPVLNKERKGKKVTIYSCQIFSLLWIEWKEQIADGLF